MPSRISRVSVPSAAPSGKASSHQTAGRKRKQRRLDAFSIAEEADGATTKRHQHRLGELEDGAPNRKRQRVAEDEDDLEASRPQRQRHAGKEDPDSLDLSGSSDSEDGEWRIGQVGSDDDSDIDSDEAFGESDEERFEGFKFGGSSSRATRKNSSQNPDAESEDEEDEDLGEDAVDLAAVLDEEDNDTSDERQGRESNAASGDEMNDEVQDESESGEEDASSIGFSDSESDADDPEKQQQLKDIAKSFSSNRDVEGDLERASNQQPTFASALAALKQSSGLDPAFENEVKKLSKSIRPSKGDKKRDLVQAPLPKRQQDRIDRKAAYSKAKDTLNRWIDTVKHNRRADHLVFPMPDPQAQEPQGLDTFVPTPQKLPRNDLENAIQNIMEQSGLNKEDNKTEEDHVLESEGLQAKRLPVEEVMARTAELRRARELLFREEARAKRIKKIKSKAFRRVHRKDAQKAAQKERNLLAAAGIDVSEDEREANDRRRAEERMGARHKESKWAKNMKHTGRAAWDIEARDGVQEMARRNDDLRKRIQGQPISDDNKDDSDSGSESDELSDSGVQPRRRGGKLLNDIQKLDSSNSTAQDSSKLSSMRFMQRAEAGRKKQNDAELESIQKALNGENSDEDEDAIPEQFVGRKLFGPGTQSNLDTIKSTPKEEKLEFEEPEDRKEDEEEIPSQGLDRQPPELKNSISRTGNNRKTATGRSNKSTASLPHVATKPFTAQSDLTGTTMTTLPKAREPAVASNDYSKGRWTTIDYPSDSERKEEVETRNENGSQDHGLTDAMIPSNLELVRSAFGGDDVEAAFAADKASAVFSEDEKVIDNTLPGWGSWTGEGISKREKKRAQQRTKNRFLTKEEGVKPTNRKDKGMDKVIISEKRNKKNTKYLASMLPYPFESRQQYERGITQPIGPEWSTKETFQTSTKPRVLVKPGRLIEPISAPIV